MYGCMILHGIVVTRLFFINCMPNQMNRGIYVIMGIITLKLVFLIRHTRAFSGGIQLLLQVSVIFGVSI